MKHESRKENNWEEEFDEQFSDFYDIGVTAMDEGGHLSERGSEKQHYEKLKNFIREQRQQAYEQGKQDGKEETWLEHKEHLSRLDEK